MIRPQEALLAWTPARDSDLGGPSVEVGPLLREHDSDWTKNYRMTGGAAYTSRRKMTDEKAMLMLLVDFHSLVVRDGIPPLEAHRQFLKVKGFSDIISPDIEGATSSDDDF